jgi:UDP-N-acetylglucosamine 1-carboxyvinyltransferase
MEPEHHILPDMIEVGSFIGLAAMTQSAITIKNAGIEHLGMIPDKFKLLGINMEYKGDDIFIPAQEHYEIQKYMDGGVLTMYDHPWPGFTPDLLSIILVTAIQAHGSVLIHQKCLKADCFLQINLLKWVPNYSL